MTAIDERLTTTGIDTPKRRAYAVLDKLIDLPVLAHAKWTIDANGHLDAYIPDRPGEDRRPMVRACVTELGLQLRSLPMHNEPAGTVCFEAVGKYCGVYLTIWTPHYSYVEVSK
jgi:hypothetical protein